VLNGGLEMCKKMKTNLENSMLLYVNDICSAMGEYLMTGYKSDWMPCVLLLSMVLFALYELDSLGIGFVGGDTCFVYICLSSLRGPLRIRQDLACLINNPHEGRVIVRIVTSSNATNTSTSIREG
jgi:hypothetical protein